jgi:hypothetical protein
MKIFKKHDDILKVNSEIIVFPRGLYQVPNNTILKKIKLPKVLFIQFNDALAKHKIDIGSCFAYGRFDGIKAIGLLITCFNVNDEIDNNNGRKIDYEMLYSSLEDLRHDIMLERITKIAFCMDDLITLGCDEEIFKAMVKQVFGRIYNPISITFVYGKQQPEN